MLNMLVFVLGTSPDDVQEHKSEKKTKPLCICHAREKEQNVHSDNRSDVSLPWMCTRLHIQGSCADQSG